MEGLKVGSIVHYVLESGRSKGEHRPAIVVRDWSNSEIASYPDGVVNVQVFTDGSNDNLSQTHTFHFKDGEEHGLHITLDSVWRTSVHYSDGKEPGTWHWIEKA